MWNAFASNNSGSYSIVGSFPSVDIAEQVAAELLPVIKAHSDWMNTRPGWDGPGTDTSPSPLRRWAADNALQRIDDGGEEWPEHSGENTPSVIVAGSQVLIHEDYTASMPKAFGEFFYRRGGRVDIELNHAHHPLITVLRFWVPWNDPQRSEREYEVLALRESIDAPDSALRALLAEGTDLVIREISFGMYWFEVAAVFSDLVAGVGTARDLAQTSGLSLGLTLSEAWTSQRDPLAHLRDGWAQDRTP